MCVPSWPSTLVPSLPTLAAIFALVLSAEGLCESANEPPETDASSVFNKQNLVAWCIVPFDAAKRTPEQRAEMLQRLGLCRVAYDWRAEHVPTFEREILAYKQHGLEYFAFWSWHADMAPLIRKHAIHPQIWQTCPSPSDGSQAERVDIAAQKMLPLALQAKDLDCRLGLYNHGGWGGEPDNLIAVCERLRTLTRSKHIGIVYNLHHGHGHIRDFALMLARLRPYLLCLNLNGMNDNAQPKILPLGKGQRDLDLLQTIADSGYGGPIGILDHRNGVDAEQSLRENMEGLKTLVSRLDKQ